MIENQKLKTLLPFVIVLGLAFYKIGLYYMVKYRTLKDNVLMVKTITAKKATQVEHISLPGSLTGWHEAPLYSRANGYLHEWFVDIGYHVKKGDILATVERPELDAKFTAARDYLEVMKANDKLAQITKNRWNRLVLTDSVSRQANDNKTYEALAISNAKNQAQSNVNKLSAYVEFEEIIAPFDGVISDRRTDNGRLINVGSFPLQNEPLFRIVQTNPLRLYVNIPQIYTPRLKQNMVFELRLNEFPGQTFKAKLLKTAEAIDPITLTLQSEFEVYNDNNTLLPGSYTTVEFFIPRDEKDIILPVNTLLFQADGLQVAVVDKENRIELRNVNIAKDYGDRVLISAGVKTGEKIIINPPDTLFNKELVNVIA